MSAGKNSLQQKLGSSLCSVGMCRKLICCVLRRISLIENWAVVIVGVSCNEHERLDYHASAR